MIDRSISITVLIAVCVVFAGCSSLQSMAANKKPLKVFILAGQSNMVGMASVSTFEHIKMFPRTKAEFKDMFKNDGSPVVLDDVRISSVVTQKGGGQEEALGKLGPTFGARGTCIGPEYTFGIYMHKKLQEPFLIIKTSWGGKSLNFNFRSPSAGKWTPPKGHPDLVKVKPKPLPIPEKVDLPVDYKPGEEYLNPYARHLGFFMFKGMRGCAIGEYNGVHPIYICQDIKVKAGKFPLKKGDVLLGIEGSGFRKNPKDHWRGTVYGEVTQSDWMLDAVRWRAGRIEKISIDLAEFGLEGGRAGIAKAKEQSRANAAEREKQRGKYYKMMMDHINMVLKDIKRVHPAYDPKPGYEIAGFVWFQGWNDLVDSGTYPNRHKPRGYEQYSWLMAHFIRDVRKELKAPKMPFVIGALGVGGYENPPTSNKGYFQQGQAAAADFPEFKGNVAAVQTGKYWDHQLAELDMRSYEVSLKQKEFQIKDKLEGDALKKAYAEYRATKFTPKEEEILKKGKSNKGFHYLGSAKIMAGIGKGFAEAMTKLMEKE